MCEGDLLTTIGSTIANEKRRGKVIANIDDYDLGGNDSIIGAYLRLNDHNGKMKGCCEIQEYQNFWKG